MAGGSGRQKVKRGRESQRTEGRLQPDIRAIAVTGSGREAVATLLRAVVPEFEDRIIVLDEIAAHTTAASR